MRTTHTFMYGNLSNLLKENKLEPINNKLAYLYDHDEKIFSEQRYEYY
jgi:hypothetical protein